MASGGPPGRCRHTAGDHGLAAPVELEGSSNSKLIGTKASVGLDADSICEASLHLQGGTAWGLIWCFTDVSRR